MTAHWTSIRRGPGRPPTLSPVDIADNALQLFAVRGFEMTTMDDLADALGIGRRTLFRYFRSKNDIVWGNFDAVLDRLRHHLDESPLDEPLLDSLTRAVVLSNRYEPPELDDLRIRMTLITTVPALQAHSMVRYAAWRRVVSEFAARRLAQQPDDLVPLTMGHAALGMSMAAFIHWVENPTDDLETNLRSAYRLLALPKL
jgi:mycofactocin system transcriptional regulator